MGSFPGHVLPGTLFLLVGVWHIWCSVMRYISNPKSFRVRVWNPVPGFDGKLKYLELYVITIGGFIDMCIELFYSTHLKWFVNGILNPRHMNNFEHGGMLLMFFIFGLITLLSEKTSSISLPQGALCLIAATAFCAEYFLFYFHSTTHQGLEGYYHLILVLLIGLCIASTVGGALMPTSFPVDLFNGIFITLQGLWFYQTAFTLYGPMMPDGCWLKEDQIMCHSKESEVRGRRFKLSRIPSPDGVRKRKRSFDENLDRFIPNRSAMDFDFAHYMVTGGKVIKENTDTCSPFKEAYRKHLMETFNMNRTRILAFKNKPPTLEGSHQEPFSPIRQVESIKWGRLIPKSPEKTLDAPDMIDDFYLNLLDWSCSNVIAIALANSVYLWDASDGSTSELIVVNADDGPVTSVRWAPDGRHLAVGLNNSHVQLWDSMAGKMLRSLREGRRSRIGSLDWNNHILTTGGLDGMIINNDVRIRSHLVGAYRGHSLEVCGLKWSASGQQLASGGNDNLVHIWSISTVSSNARNRWIYRLEDHTSAVKALAWCPFQGNLLASGGGIGDHCIKFWNVHSAACLNSLNTGSQVCSLIWNKHERELLSSHGLNDNQLALWKYPSMVKTTDLYAHTSRVLCLAQSPDGYTVASAAADETLRIWNVFGNPKLAKKPAAETKEEPFPNVARIR